MQSFTAIIPTAPEIFCPQTQYACYSVVKSDVILQLGPLEIRSVAAPLKTAFSEAVNLFTNTSFSRKEALRAKKGLSAFNSDRLIHVNVLTRGVIKD